MNMVPLYMIKTNKHVKIKKITGKDEVIKKLREMGLFEGEDICVLTNSNGLIVIIKDNLRLALGKELSRKILVEEVH